MRNLREYLQSYIINAQITIRNIHVRIEQPVSATKVTAIGFFFPLLKVESTDSNWNPKIGLSPPWAFNVTQLKQFTVYFSQIPFFPMHTQIIPDAEFLKRMCYFSSKALNVSRDREAEAQPMIRKGGLLKYAVHRTQTASPSNRSLSDLHFLLSPIDVTLRMSFNINKLFPSIADPVKTGIKASNVQPSDVSLSLSLPLLRLSFTPLHISGILNILDTLITLWHIWIDTLIHS